MPPAEPKCALGTQARKGLSSSPFRTEAGHLVRVRMDLARPKMHPNVPEYMGKQPTAHEEAQALCYDSLWSQDLKVTVSPQQGCRQPALWSLHNPFTFLLPLHWPQRSPLAPHGHPLRSSLPHGVQSHTAARTAKHLSQASPAHP